MEDERAWPCHVGIASTVAFPTPSVSWRVAHNRCKIYAGLGALWRDPRRAATNHASRPPAFAWPCWSLHVLQQMFPQRVRLSARATLQRCKQPD